MNEDALREMVREALGRRLGLPAMGRDAAPANVPAHVSHDRYELPESGGPCVIEPAVTCDHCGYCQSHGH